MKTFDIIVPVYRNENNLDNTIPRLLVLYDILFELGYKTTIVFVEDGSPDKSYSIIQRYYKMYSDRISIVKLTRNFGQIYAIQAGLNYSKSDYTGIISADLQDPEMLFVDMIKEAEQGTKLVIAERESRDESAVQRFFSSRYWSLIRRYGMNDFPKGGFDFCLLSKEVVDSVIKISEKNTNIFPAIFWLGYRYKIIKYKREKRNEGKSSWTLSKKIKLTVDTLIGFTRVPIRMITFSGLISAVLSVIYIFYIIVRWVVGGGVFPLGWTTIIVALSFFSGLILFSLGVICEYLLRILDETRKRPNYIIDEIIDSK